jgi:septal ring factor EnvC (AmiA/AmiB activator)
MTQWRFIAVLAVLVMTVVPATAAKDDAGQRLDSVNRALEQERKQRDEIKTKAVRLDDDVRRLRRDLVVAARVIQDQEEKIANLESRLRTVRDAETKKSASLLDRRNQFARVLLALERMARHPPEALISHPLSPKETVRGAILLRAAVPQIERRAKRLRHDLAEITRARRDIAERRAELAAATAAMTKQRAHLDTLLGKKLALKRRTTTESRKASRRIQALAREAKDLRDLLARLETERVKREKQDEAAALRRPAAPPQRRPAITISKARGKLPFPVVGRVAGLYGQTTKTGLTRRGITIETATGAQVVAPHEGRVVFAGSFRGYGQLLIIEHGEGYHSLLAGLTRIDSAIGQTVLAGEPVGVMGRRESDKPILYVELRRDGQPINPLPWLAARKGKVSG